MPIEPDSAKADLSGLRINRAAPQGENRWMLPVGAVLLLAVAGGAWWSFGSGARLPEVVTGVVRVVGSSEGSALLSAGGYLLPDRKANVSSKTFGRLEWIGIDVGSVVKKDEIIARLANADLTARLEEAKASLADADREFARWKKAVDDGVEPHQRLDQAETALNLARARVKTAEADLDYMIIRAPFDGTVTRKSAELGETVGPLGSSPSGATSGALCTIVDLSTLEMVADVNETNIAKIHVGQQVEIAADALPERKVRGEVRQIVPTADRQKGIVQVKVRLLDAETGFLPEMAARATFLREGKAAGGAKRIMAPREALRERGGRKFVLVVEGGRLREVSVETGVDGEDGIEISKGLLGGEIVVVGGDPVEDGAEVRVKGKN